MSPAKIMFKPPHGKCKHCLSWHSFFYATQWSPPYLQRIFHEW
jgi:hypothetical protein